jgi:hypothetical protein
MRPKYAKWCPVKLGWKNKTRISFVSGRESRARLHDSAWFCNFTRCDVAYFNLFDKIITVDELKTPVYPKNPDSPICT